jgi:diguanylate cyclase (GGDEF)-like protein
VQRLAAVHATGLIGTPSEERIDRFTRLAQRMFDMPIALVNLIGSDMVWVKSCTGRDLQEAPRELTFCAHAILDDDVMVVMDATKDERFASNPLVRGEPHFRFYAGCPIYSADNHRIGTLCLLDYQPRIFSSQDRELLRDLAETVQAEIIAVQLATTDELTGLSNRRGLRDVGSNALALCRRFDKHAVLLFIDLDDFKQVNDAHGHLEGDRALREFAGLLWEAFRQSDVVARMGGDEFCVLASGASPQACRAPLARFRARVAERNARGDEPYALNYSEGWVEYDPALHRSIDDLVRDADHRMYAHKQALSETTA